MPWVSKAQMIERFMDRIRLTQGTCQHVNFQMLNKYIASCPMRQKNCHEPECDCEGCRLYDILPEYEYYID